MPKLNKDFFIREDVVDIGKELLGKCLFTKIDGQLTAGIVTETEAYAGVSDKASHAYNNRRTKRTEIMFAEGGKSYVYLCYGIHCLFNIVTNVKDVPHAVLIRSIKPFEGIKTILKRRNHDLLTARTCSGPGTLSQALGIQTKHSGLDLTKKAAPESADMIWLEDIGIKVMNKEIVAGPRIGVDYAQEDALLPYRFRIAINYS